ncbi:MAG: phosphodiesterase [Synechococcales cyanobacterium]
MRRLRFVQLSDTHIMAGTIRQSWWMPGSPTDQLCQAFRQIGELGDVDFVVITGDLVDGADAESYALLEELLATCPVPFYLSVGNHDLIDVMSLRCQERLQKTRPRYARPQALSWLQRQFSFQVAPTGFLDYSLSPYLGVRLIVLDSSIDTLVDGDLACSVGVLKPPQLDWLATELAAHPDEWVVVLVHHPPFVTAISRPWSPFLFREYRILPAMARQLHDTLRRHPRIATVLSGHWHLPQLYQQHGIPYLTAPGLVGPIPAFRVFDLDLEDGTLRYTWHTVRSATPRPVPLWAPLACGRPWDRQGVIYRSSLLSRLLVKL